MAALELYHHGVKGQKWGVRRTPEQLGHRNLKKSRTANMDKWGKDPEHNVLYVGGYSGSGKSTVAKSLADKSTDVLHLDLYFEEGTSGGDSRCKAFDTFLSKNRIRKPDGHAIESFGQEQYKKGRKVIAEGVQVLDGSVSPDKSFFADKPVALLSTNPVTSMQRAFNRDGRGNLVTGLKNLDSPKEYINWYVESHNQISELTRSSHARRGEEWVKNYLEGVTS